MINVGQQVVTSKGRYGRVIDVDNSSSELKVLVKIGTKNYWILESQLTPATHIVRVKVEYEIDYCGKSITDSLEVALKRDTVLYNDNVNYLAQLCKDKVERQLEMEVKVKQIKNFISAMTFDLKVITIETKPRAGYFILDEGEFSTVKKVVPQRSEVYLDNGKILSIADASKKVAKLIGEVTTEQEDKVITKTYSIIHSDFSGIIRGLYDTIPYGDDVSEEDRKYKTLRDALFAGVKVRYEGAFETILTRTVVDEVVEISSLSVVDRYQLYSRDDRVGVVTKFDKDSHWFQIKLNTSGTVVKCKREDFTKLHNDNTIQMLHTLCSRCGR